MRAVVTITRLLIACTTLFGSTLVAQTPQTPIRHEPGHWLHEPPAWQGQHWRIDSEQTLATVELDHSWLELVEVQYWIADSSDDSSPSRAFSESLYQLVEVTIDELGASMRRPLFEPRLLRPAFAECVGEAWPEELSLDIGGGPYLAARALLENLVQPVTQHSHTRLVIAFICDGRAADGGAWDLVMVPIVMGRVRMELAEVVFRGYLGGRDGGLGVWWVGRED